MLSSGGFGNCRPEPLLDSLVNREFVVPRAASTLASEAEYAFRHALTRDVAYEQLTRDRRARKHARVAGWIETVAPPGGLADLLTYHYEAALDLAVATSDDELASALMPSTASALEAAGDRRSPSTSPPRNGAIRGLRRSSTRTRQAGAAFWASGRTPSGRAAARGRPWTGKTRLSRLWRPRAARRRWHSRGREVARRFEVDSGEWPRLPGIADDLLRDGSESAGLIPLLEYWAYVCFFRGDRAAGMAAATRAIEVAARLGLPASVKGLR